MNIGILPKIPNDTIHVLKGELPFNVLEGGFMNKSKMAYERDKLMLALVGETCPAQATDVADYEQEYEEYKHSLDEINAMISHFLAIGDAAEVASWRRMLMHNKMVMRELKSKMMDAKMIQEVAYS